MRRKLVAAAIAATVLGGLAGCDPDEKPDNDGGDALTRVRAAAAKTADGTAHVTMSVPNVDVAGDTDPAGRALALRITTGTGGDKVEQQVRVLGDKAFYTLGKTYLPGIDPAKFIAFDAAGFATTSLVHLADPFDPAGLKGLGPAIVDAQATESGTYTGKLDLTAAPAGTSRGLLPATPEQLEGAGEKIKTISYVAAVDGDGRLTSLTVMMPAYGRVPAYTSTSRFSDLGKPVSVAEPGPAEIAEVPDAVRKLLTR